MERNLERIKDYINIFALMGIVDITAFVVASFLFIISPGVDTVFILNKSLAHGKRSGIYSTLGIATGVLIHTAFAAFGLSLILAESAMAFNIVKYLGAAYLVYLGIMKFVSKGTMLDQRDDDTTTSMKGTYLSAVLTNTLNPKVAIFFVAFFPQFIAPTFLNSALPFVVLGLIYAALSLCWFFILTLFSGTFSHKLKASNSFSIWLSKISAVTFVLMGIKIALTRR